MGIRELTGPGKFVVVRLARALLILLGEFHEAYPDLLGVAHGKLKGYLTRSRKTLTQNATAYEDGLAPMGADDKWFDAMPTYTKGIHPPCVNDETSSLEGQHNGLKSKGGGRFIYASKFRLLD